MHRIDEFRNEMLKQNMSEKTVKSYCNNVHSYFCWLDNKYNSDTTNILYRQNILEYIEYLKICKLSPKTINVKITSLKKFGEIFQPEQNVIRKGDYLETEIIEKITIDISNREVECFLQRVLYTKNFHSLRDYTIIYLMAYEGIYLSEALRIKRDDLMLENNQLIIRNEDNLFCKSLDIDSKTVNVLKCYIDGLDDNSELLFHNSSGNKLNNTTINKVFDTYNFGNKRITPTKLRQFYYINAFKSGKTVEEIKKRTGATNKTLLKYMNLKNEIPVYKKDNSSILPKQNKTKVNINTNKNNGYVYFVSDGKYVKIGVATGTVEERLKALQTGNPNKLVVLNSLLVDNPFEVESNYHLLFKNKHINGEWFDILDLMETIF